MPNPIPEPTDRQLCNLWAKIDEGGPDDCWNWTGGCNSAGYGMFGLGCSSMYLAHRIAYFLAKGDPGKLCVCHSCDNPKCCNPTHLFLGTRADNNRDMAEKGRATSGEKNPHSILTLAQVTEIKTTLKDPPLGMGSALARKYGVSTATISRIKTGKRWGHVNA